MEENKQLIPYIFIFDDSIQDEKQRLDLCIKLHLLDEIYTEEEKKIASRFLTFSYWIEHWTITQIKKGLPYPFDWFSHLQGVRNMEGVPIQFWDYRDIDIAPWPGEKLEFQINMMMQAFVYPYDPWIHVVKMLYFNKRITYLHYGFFMEWLRMLKFPGTKANWGPFTAPDITFKGFKRLSRKEIFDLTGYDPGEEDFDPKNAK